MHPVPFLKWAGGKRWLAPKLSAVLNVQSGRRYVEPFLGSGAVYFRLQPQIAFLADSNPELIAAYRAVRDNPELIISRLARLRISGSAFERLRSSCPRSDVSRAVRLIYLNRTAFNGLYRVNQRGRFNVPFGCKPGTLLCDAEELTNASQTLKGIDVVCQDFRETLNVVNPKNDIVYIDPPYTVKHDNNGFRRYNQRIFTWADQVDLASLVVNLVKDGAPVLVSNARHADVRRLYPKALFHAIELKRATCMAANSARRGTCDEVLLVSSNVIGSQRRLRQHLLGD